MSKTESPRQAAYRLLKQFLPENTQHKANSLIDQALGMHHTHWSAADQGLFTTLVYGVLRYWFQLEATLSPFCHQGFSALPKSVQLLLRLGAYQLLYLDRVPAHAAVHETVELAKQERVPLALVKVINGILRSMTRKSITPLPPQPETFLPAWFANWAQKQGIADLDALVAVLNTLPPLTLRVNVLNCSLEAYQQALTQRGISFVQPDSLLPECLLLSEHAGAITALPGYAEGWFSVQDPSAAMVSYFLAPKPGESVLDLCAAPGNKTSHLAALMNNTGQIVAIEPSPKRVERLKTTLERLGVNNTRVCQLDGTQVDGTQVQASALGEDSPTDGFDRILVDAPCSGLGTVHRHPEILVQLGEAQILAYPDLQYRLLRAASQLLKPSGILVYSTCSIAPEENQQVVARFLSDTPEFILLEQLQRPIQSYSDGFFMAKLQKR